MSRPATIREAVGYEQFWPFFLEVHRERGTRMLHGVATVLGLVCALVAFPLTLNPAWLLMALGVSYPIAWVSHFVFERRVPAAFTNPFWAFLCDIEMLALMAKGRLDVELERVRHDPSAPVSRRRRLARRFGQLAMGAYVAGYAALELLDMTRFGWPF